MADVHVTYSVFDRAVAERFAHALKEAGLSVSFDTTLHDSDAKRPHKMGASIVVVLWSAKSVDVDFVKLEARAASRLVSVYIERVEHQNVRGTLLEVDLSDWQGGSDHPEFQRLVAGIRSELAALRLRDESFGNFRDESSGSRARKVEPDASPTTIIAEPTVSALSRTKVAANSPQSIGAEWETVRAYLYPESDEANVTEDAQRLRPSADGRHTSRHASVSKIRVGTPITVIIHLPGAECRRTEQRFTWRGHWHKTDFDVRYTGEPINKPQEGRISWFAGMVCVGDVSFDVHFTSEQQVPSGPAFLARAPGYESVFVSYSTKDSAIVDWLEMTYTALGMTYLRDIKTLRSGERWDETLLKLIQGADLFQLCWSTNAKQSLEVTNEWRFALAMQKPNFIRPCYWDEPMPEPPSELQQLHFARLKLNWFTRMWFRLRARFGRG